MRKTSKVSIDVYDADGELCESIGGPMDFEDVKELGKALMDVLHIDNEGNRARPAPAEMEVSKFLPTLLLKWEFEGVKFEAVGKYDDVMDAQAELLRTILKE